MHLDAKAAWFNYLSDWQQDLVETSFVLSEKKTELGELNDFSFIIFPMAKAYEGFLKKMLYDLKLITESTYFSRRFRIGRALNPDINYNQRDAWWLYDDIARELGEDLARELWEAWLKCRNRVFHFFPNGKQQITWEEAATRLKMMQDVMIRVAAQVPSIKK